MKEIEIIIHKYWKEFLYRLNNTEQSLLDKKIILIKTKMDDTTDNIASLSHTKWNCKYHIVFTQKTRGYDVRSNNNKRI